jgi:hypothetical protein
MTPNELREWLMNLPEATRLEQLRLLSPGQKEEFSTHWRLWARKDQLPPEGDWRVWLVMAGRGFGKTRAGAEWVRAVAESDPEARIALVAASLGEARAVMVEGESGVLAVCPPERRPDYESSLRRLTWPNGATATLYSGGEPESLRGPQHSHACRSGAEGGLCQRSPCPDRRLAALRYRRRSCHAADNAGRRNQLAGRHIAYRSLGRTGGQDRLPSIWQLAVCGPERRDDLAQPIQRAAAPLLCHLVGSLGTFRAQRRRNHRH